MPSVSDPAVPSHSTEVQPPPRSSIPSVLSHTLPHSTMPKWVSVTLLFKEYLLDLVSSTLETFTKKGVSVKQLYLLHFWNTKSFLAWSLSRQRTPPHPGHHCLASTTTRRRPPWCRLSPERPRWSVTRLCVGWSANQMRGRGTERVDSMLSMETVRYAGKKSNSLLLSC